MIVSRYNPEVGDLIIGRITEVHGLLSYNLGSAKSSRFAGSTT